MSPYEVLVELFIVPVFELLFYFYISLDNFLIVFYRHVYTFTFFKYKFRISKPQRVLSAQGLDAGRFRVAAPQGSWNKKFEEKCQR